MAKPVGFTAFLKLVELADGPRKSELKKKLGGGGGFQYWRPIQTVAPKAIEPGANTALLTAELETTCSGHQRKYNMAAFIAFNKWREGKYIQPAAPLPMIEADFGNSGLTIRMRPELAFSFEGVIYSMNLWATTKPILSTQTLSVGLFFLSSAYKAQGYHSHSHVIFDTIANRLFHEVDVHPMAIHTLKDKVDAFKKAWDDLNSTPSNPSSPSQNDQYPPPPK
jgi:hypothetical protein